MASLNDYKRHIQVLKMEQKIGRIQKELETVDYGDGCPLHGENDCAEVRKAYDRGYVSGLYEALTLFKLIEADTPQTEGKCQECKWWFQSYRDDGYCQRTSHNLICNYEPIPTISVELDEYEAQTDCGWK